MGVSLSIDGVQPSTIAGIRVGADPEELLANRDRFLAATRSYGREMKLNYCVMPQNWAEYLPFLLDAEELGVPVYAARVQRPAEHSLFHLPAEDLRVVLDTLEEQGATQADRLELNRATWDGTIADLTAHLAGLEDAAPPIPVTIAAKPTVGFVERLADLGRRLDEEGGVPPVHLTIRAGQITDADRPEWAGFLGPDELVGLAPDALHAAMERRLGTSVVQVPVDGEEDLQGFTYELPLDDGVIRIHSVALQDDRSADTHVLIGLVRSGTAPSAPRGREEQPVE
jgi:hypothetical protein